MGPVIKKFLDWFFSALGTLLAAMPGIVGVFVGLIVRLVFFPKNFVLGQVFSSLENTGLLFSMILLALVVVWVFDAYNWKIRALGNILFLSLLALLLIGAVILGSCLYTGEVSLISFGIPIPISISLISIPVLIYYCILFLFYHLVWEEYCTELVTVCILLFAAIYTENVMASLFALSFAIVIVTTVREYGKTSYASSDVMIYRFGKPVRKRTLTFLVLPFIEEFKGSEGSGEPLMSEEEFLKRCERPGKILYQLLKELAKEKNHELKPVAAAFSYHVISKKGRFYPLTIWSTDVRINMGFIVKRREIPQEALSKFREEITKIGDLANKYDAMGWPRISTREGDLTDYDIELFISAFKKLIESIA